MQTASNPAQKGDCVKGGPSLTSNGNAETRTATQAAESQAQGRLQQKGSHNSKAASKCQHIPRGVLKKSLLHLVHNPMSNCIVLIGTTLQTGASETDMPAIVTAVRGKTAAARGMQTDTSGRREADALSGASD